MSRLISRLLHKNNMNNFYTIFNIIRFKKSLLVFAYHQKSEQEAKLIHFYTFLFAINYFNLVILFKVGEQISNS